MEKIIFFGLAIPILAYVLYLGGTAIMKGFSAKEANRVEKEESESQTNLETTGQSINLSEELSKLNDLKEKGIISQEDFEKHVGSVKLENSYIGMMGKGIEPVVRPLGYDWKIGIAIVSSFAAREVFVGTLATIYSVGSDEEKTIKDRMAAETNPVLGGPLFNFASGISLLLFYAFAMQCMSTLAIVKRETNSWKWPILQLFVMSGIAYVAALTAFQLLK